MARISTPRWIPRTAIAYLDAGTRITSGAPSRWSLPASHRLTDGTVAVSVWSCDWNRRANARPLTTTDIAAFVSSPMSVRCARSLQCRSIGPPGWHRERRASACMKCYRSLAQAEWARSLRDPRSRLVAIKRSPPRLPTRTPRPVYARSLSHRRAQSSQYRHHYSVKRLTDFFLTMSLSKYDRSPRSCRRADPN